MRPRGSLRLAVATSAVALLPAAAGAGPDPAFRLLEPHGPYPWTVSYGVSADGGTIHGVSGSPHQGRATLWTSAGVSTDVGTLCGGVTRVAGLSGDSAVLAGTTVTAGGNRAYRWTAGGPCEILEVPGAGPAIGAHAISADGSSTVVATMGGFFLLADGQAPMPIPGATNVTAVSADGSAVVGFSEAINPPFGGGYLWTAQSGSVPIGLLPGDSQSQALGISGDGQVVVGASWIGGTVQRQHAVVTRVGAEPLDIGALPGNTLAVALAASGDGSIVVGNSGPNGCARAFIWSQPTGMQDLNEVLRATGVVPASWRLNEAVAISADGRTIAGTAIDDANQPGGVARAWTAYLPVLTRHCRADADRSGSVTSSDISAFLTLWLAGLSTRVPTADFDADCAVNSADIAAFLTAWLDAVQGGC